eukprot:COSAG01_NODE_22756_length_842_cov_1.328398_1_plen_148_part_10
MPQLARNPGTGGNSGGKYAPLPDAQQQQQARDDGHDAAAADGPGTSGRHAQSSMVNSPATAAEPSKQVDCAQHHDQHSTHGPSTGKDPQSGCWTKQQPPLRKIEGVHSAGILSACYSPDGLTLCLASDDQTASLIQVSTGKVLHKIEG